MISLASVALSDRSGVARALYVALRGATLVADNTRANQPTIPVE